MYRTEARIRKDAGPLAVRGRDIMKAGDVIMTVRAEDGSSVDIRIPEATPVAPAKPRRRRARRTERQDWLASIDKWLSDRKRA